MSDDTLDSDLESVTLKMDVSEAAKCNYFHLSGGLVFEQHACPVVSKRLGYSGQRSRLAVVQDRVWN